MKKNCAQLKRMFFLNLINVYISFILKVFYAFLRKEEQGHWYTCRYHSHPWKWKVFYETSCRFHCQIILHQFQTNIFPNFVSHLKKMCTGKSFVSVYIYFIFMSHHAVGLLRKWFLWVLKCVLPFFFLVGRKDGLVCILKLNLHRQFRHWNIFVYVVSIFCLNIGIDQMQGPNLTAINLAAQRLPLTWIILWT